MTKTLTIHDPDGDIDALEEFVNTVQRMSSHPDIDRSEFRRGVVPGEQEAAFVSFRVDDEGRYRNWVNLVDGFTPYEVR